MDVITSRTLDSASISTLALLAALPGPPQRVRQYIAETDAPYEFVPGDVTAVDGWTSIAPTGGTAGRWLLRSDSISIAPLGANADDWPRLIAGACAALAGKGTVRMRAGTWLCKTLQTLPSGKALTLTGSPRGDTTVLSSLAPNADPQNAPFSALPGGVPVVATTIAAANVVGARTVSVVASIPAGGIVTILDSVSGSSFQGNTYVVKSVAGGGPFTLTLDRPVLYQFGIGDSANQLAAIPQNLTIRDIVITGTGTRFLEITGSRWCLVERVQCVPDSGMPTDLVMSFDQAGYENEFRDCMVNGGAAAAATVGLSLETQENSHVVRGRVWDCSVAGIKFFDCAQCVSVDGNVSDCGQGIALTADGNVIGCQDCVVERGNYNKCTTGVSVVAGSTNTVLSAVNSRFCATGVGIGSVASVTKGTKILGGRFTDTTATAIVSQLATGTQIKGVEIENCVTGLNLQGSVDVDGCKISGTITTNAVILGAAGTWRFRGLEVIRAAGAAAELFTMDSGTAFMEQSRFDDNAGKCIRIDGGSLTISTTTGVGGGGVMGIYINGGTCHVGDGCDFSGCPTPYRRDAGTFTGIEEFSYGIIGIPTVTVNVFPLIGALPIASVPIAVGSAQAKLPGPRTFYSIRADLGVAPGGVQTVVCTLQKNGVDTAITVTITGAAVTGTFNVQFPPSWAPDDFLSLKVLASATSIAADLRVVVESSSSN